MLVNRPPLPARRVRRLHVRAATDDVARHAATLLGDALRTASLRAADEGRLVVIRRLALGRIADGISAASLALHIERIAENVISQAVTYDLPAAGSANAVVFSGRGAAVVTLARVHARGATAHEWFWPEVAAGWRADASPGERWQLLLDAAHGGPDGAIVAAAVVDEAIDAKVEDVLLSSAAPGQGARWLRLAGWSGVSPDAAPPQWRRPVGRREETLRRWRRTWGSSDDRLIWLATLMTVVEHPACVADPRLPARIAFALKSFEGGRPSPQDYQAGTLRRDDRLAIVRHQHDEADDDAISLRSDVPAGIDAVGRLVSVEDPRRAASGDPFEPPAEVTRPAAVRPAHELPPVEAEARPVLSHAFTAFAGLLLVVPILERLEFAAFLASHPTFLDAGFPARLLLFIGQRAGLPADDPLARACRAGSGEGDDAVSSDIESIAFDLPTRAREILSSPAPRTVVDSPFTAWLTAVRRWCRRNPRIGLTTLIRRPGHVHISRTHIDACFALSQIDVRVRRLALDVDPGWVPWLGRVVQFSYGDYHDRE